MRHYRLTNEEIDQIRRSATDLAQRFRSGEDPMFIREAALSAHELPRAVRRTLYDFKLEEPAAGLLLISGWPVDDASIGPTPSHWKLVKSGGPSFTEETLMMLLGSLLGEPVGWSTQQDGRLIHHVMPIREHEHAQLGSGSRELLWWHNEDAFHALRPDYVILMCLRNHDRVATTYGSLEHIQLEPWQVTKLFEPHYTIRPDNSHQPAARGDDGYDSAGYASIAQMNNAPERIAVFYGDRSSPYLRLDPYFMAPVEHDPEAQLALDALVKAMDAAMVDLVLAPGDVCILDNHRAVHGRRPFQARFDGTDRWLERILIARDLRRSRTSRRSSVDRILY